MKEIITKEEIEFYYNKLIEKKTKNSHLSFLKKTKNEVKISEFTSLCPIGSDGLTTKIVENKKKSIMFSEIHRTLNQVEKFDENIPRYIPISYKIIEKGENPNKRVICIPSLRDQIVLEFLHNKLKSSQIIESNYFKNNSVKNILIRIKKELEGEYYYVIRTDIKKYFDNINLIKLKDQLLSKLNCLDLKTINLIFKFLKNEKSINQYKGIPTGISISSILSEFYLKDLNKNLDNDNLKMYRYADDILIFVKSKEINPSTILTQLDFNLKQLCLERSPEKTKTIKVNESFQFLGVTISRNCFLLDEQKTINWKEKINKSLKKEFHFHELSKVIDKNYILPKNQEIIKNFEKNNILVKHMNFIKKLNIR